MNNSQEEIRNLIDQWFEATKLGDINTILTLMSDDVVFMTVGNEPFGKEEFRKSAEKMKGVTFEGSYDIKELQVIGEYAYVRNYIELSGSVKRSGYTLTILRKEDGLWKLIRDANLMSGH